MNPVTDEKQTTSTTSTGAGNQTQANQSTSKPKACKSGKPAEGEARKSPAKKKSVTSKPKPEKPAKAAKKASPAPPAKKAPDRSNQEGGGPPQHRIQQERRRRAHVRRLGVESLGGVPAFSEPDIPKRLLSAAFQAYTTRYDFVPPCQTVPSWRFRPPVWLPTK